MACFYCNKDEKKVYLMYLWIMGKRRPICGTCADKRTPEGRNS
jgi:hypothetical protein